MLQIWSWYYHEADILETVTSSANSILFQS